jgi:hypothetical protein
VIRVTPLRIGLCVLASCASASLRADALDVHGALSARGIAVSGPPGWLEGGFGRLTEGGRADGTRALFRGEGQLGLDWRPGEAWLLRVHASAHGEPSSAGGQRAGLAEAFVQFRPELTARTALRLRAGLFFPPTSLENVEPLWQSPYTVTLSALNTWIGEELRLSGADAAVVWQGERHRLELGGAAFGAADTSGALLAWRGFAFGDRLSTVGETLPLPPLVTLGPGGAFADQRDDGTRPVDELDDRVGWHARARFARESAFRLQAAYTDNRGDRALHRGQYAWRTRVAQAGLEANLGASVVIVAEAAAGDTGMGPAVVDGPHVDLRFRVGYVLVSWRTGRFRLSGRVDAFDGDDRDGTAEPNGERGWSATGAVFYQPARILRLGAEYVAVRADRDAAAFSGAARSTDADRATVELRLVF